MSRKWKAYWLYIGTMFVLMVGMGGYILGGGGIGHQHEYQPVCTYQEVGAHD